MRNPTIDLTFPADFIAAAEAVWKEKANMRLMGAVQSLQRITVPSERQAAAYMTNKLRVSPFLTEKSLESLVYAAPGCTTGATVDFVGLDHLGRFVLVEAKPQIDSATLRGQPPQNKFGHTLSQLHAFYRLANLPVPALSRAIVTSSGGVQISEQSSWAVVDGKLTRNTKLQTVNPGLVPIQIVEI